MVPGVAAAAGQKEDERLEMILSPLVSRHQVTPR